MPLYVQLCKDCAKMYEVVVPLDQYDDPVPCPHCGKETRRVITGAYFSIK